MSSAVSMLDELRAKQTEALERLQEWGDKIDALPADAKEEEVTFLKDAFAKTEGEVQRWSESVERQEVIVKARAAVKPQAADDDNKKSERVSGVKEPLTYRKGGQHSFFTDMFNAGHNGDAVRRLERHAQEMRVERRDLTTSSTPGGGGFIPPIYLSSEWINSPRAGRPFADAVRKMELSAVGMRMDFPRVQTGSTAAIQAAENNAVSETDLDSEVYSVNVNTIAGQNDVSRQLLERSQPGIDEVIFGDLMADYDAKLDTQLLSGAGNSGQHQGIRTASGVNTVAYTDGSPTAAELVPKLYDGIQKVATNRFQDADTIVMHPRRAAWLASNLSSTFPLFQLGGLYQASGTQNNGFTNGIAGLQVIRDANVGVLYGASTTEDEIYVVRSNDLILAEGPLAARVFEDVGSGTLTVRLQVYAYSAFAIRLAKAVSVLSGTGLIAPTF
jgi:HK97 family phage major capsid protein